MADNNNPFGLPQPIVPGGNAASNPLSVFREAMGTLAPQIPNGQPMSVPTGQNIAGNYQTGPNPVAKRPNGTMDALQQNVNFLNQASNWAQDKNAYGRTYFYGAGIHGANFERYYNHPKFKSLGFNPMRNNEVLYNQASSWWDDFSRMTSSYGSLFGAGFKSMYDFGSKDTAKEFEKAMAVGMSSRGGVGGFFTNLALNSAFTMGLTFEMIAENFAIAGLTTATGGLAAAPALAAATGKNAMGFQKVFQFRDVLKGTTEMLKQLTNVNKAREMWNSGKGVSTAEKVFDFVNPLSRTQEYVKDLYKGTNGFDKMNDFVKTRKAFGAMYRDLREVNAVFSESLMEGEMAKNEFNQKLIDDYYNKNGVMPEGEAAQRIYDTSMNVGFATSLANAPAIYFSNKLIFDNIFNGFKPPSVVGKELIEGSKRALTRNKNWKLGDNVYSFMERNSSQKMKDILLNSSYMPWSKKYLLGNLAEGIQEVSQDIVSASATKYYEDIYNDPTAAGLYNALAAVGTASQDQFSMKGLETFLSGYLMGSLVQPVGEAMTNWKWAPALYKKYFKSEEYQKQVQKERDNENNVVNAVNTILKNPLGYFDRNVEHAVRSKRLTQAMEQAELNGDQKAYHDAKELLSYEHMMIVTETGKTDLLNEQLDGLLEMNDTELEEAFNQKGEGANIRKRLEDSKQQVLEFKNTYDAFTEKYQNPFNPKAYDPEKDKEGWNKEMAKFIGFEEARRDAVMATALYGKTVSRMQSVFNDLSANKIIRNAKTNDFTVLLSQDNLTEEIGLLSREIDVLKEGDAQQKKKAKLKQKKLDALREFKDYGLLHQMALAESKKELTRAEKKARALSLGSIVKSKRTGEKFEIIEDLGDYIRVETKSGMVKRFKKKNVLPVTDSVVKAIREGNKGLYKKFMAYANIVAEENNDKRVTKEGLDSAFIKVRDWFNLNEDAQNLVDTVNMLHNPSMFMRHAEQQAMVQAFKRENLPGYIRSAYRKMHDHFKDSAFLNEIYDLGFTIDPDDAQRIIYNDDYTNINFYYQTSGEPVESTDPKLVQARKVVEKYAEIARLKKEAEDKTDGVEKPAEEEKEEQPEQKPAEKVEEQIPNYEIYKQLVALFRKSEAEKAKMGEATAGLENVPDNDLRNVDQNGNFIYQAFGRFITSNSEAIALTEKLPKPEEKGKPTEQEIKEEDWTPQPVPAGLEKLKNLYKEVVKLTKDEKNYFNSEGELWDRVSSIKREKQGLPGENILKLSAQRGNVIDIIIREMFKGNIQNKVDMLKMIKDIVRKENYSVQFDNKAVEQLFEVLDDVYNSVKAEGFTIHSDIPTLFGTIKGLNTPQGGNIAGTIDLLAEKDGKFYIIDLKTATTDRKSEEGKGRYLEDDTIQLNAYRELIKQQTGVDIEGIFIFPMTVTQGKGYKVISSVTAPKFTMDELIPIEKKSLKELRPELFEEAPAAPAPTAPAGPLNGIGSVSFDIPGITLEGFEIDGNRYNVLTHFERAKTLVNINGVIVPFYLTSGSGGKGLIPGWYPFAGIGQDGWLNKTGKADMETYYSRLIGAENADMLKRVAQKLNETYGTDPAAYKPDADPTVKDKPISTMAEKTEDYINSKLSFKPVSNNTSTTLSGFEANMRQLGDALTNAQGVKPAAPVSGIEKLEQERNQALLDALTESISYEDFIKAWENGYPLVEGRNSIDLSYLNIVVDGRPYQHQNLSAIFENKKLPLKDTKFYPVTGISSISAESTRGTEWIEKQAITFDQLKGKDIRRDVKQIVGASGSFGLTLKKAANRSPEGKKINQEYDAKIAALGAAPVEEVKTEPEVKGETLESMVEEAKTPAGYETLRGKLLEKLRTDAAFRNKYNLTAESVKEILKNKYNELAMTFTAEDIKGDKKTFIILKDGTQAMVVDRTKSTFTYQRMVDGAPEGAVVERPLSQLYDVVQSIYKAGMENIKPVEPVVAEPVAADSKKESDNSLKDAEDPGVVQDTANEAIASTMNKDEALENLKNKLC